jgi:import receptor subunit TOM20
MQSILTCVSQETFPETAEGKEAYFTEQVAMGEQMLLQARQDDSVVHFYKALKVYPVPLELIMIYQQSLPEQVFRILVNLMALEVDNPKYLLSS